MTYRSESRGFMYTAPPGPDEAENRAAEVEAAETTETAETAASEGAATDEESPQPESATAATDANWTGTVSADD